MMLDHLGEHGPARAIEAALLRTFADGVKPRDLGGVATSSEFADAVIARLTVPT